MLSEFSAFNVFAFTDDARDTLSGRFDLGVPRSPVGDETGWVDLGYRDGPTVRHNAHTGLARWGVALWARGGGG